MKAFRLTVNRSVTWADWAQDSGFDGSLTGFAPGEIDQLLVLEDDAPHPEAAGRLFGDRKTRLMITDPQYGMELDSEWRDRAGLNGCGPSCMLRCSDRRVIDRKTAVAPPQMRGVKVCLTPETFQHPLEHLGRGSFN